ncbi:hypothetical protein [Streptomyces noursei]|uniref:hypothetical protein n=1 Tax=Streptomyces noursei TaxID=1971 RepID=UPI00167987B4|nr:hypothetical protein [Streptomyces noursei]MCZ1015583.1 hypothetical protein [Streptomyces noursei]GGW89253.1 hypothetical protein GCM10010341_07540 [Streptomyces noursei]
MDKNGFEELVGGLEAEFNAARLEKRGTFAVAAARITGLIYLEAVQAGVPHLLAQEMAQDYWNTEAGGPTVVVAEAEDE